MKNLIIFSHPHLYSYTFAIVNKVSNILKEKNEEVKIVDLYMKNFNPVLSEKELILANKGESLPEIKIYQKKIVDSNRIIFVYPIWWSQMPAMMKGFIDRVFTKGFAYTINDDGSPNGLLSDKKVVAISPLGTSRENAEKEGLDISLKQTLVNSVYGFCGMKVEHHIMIYSVTSSSEFERKNWLECLKAYF